MPSLSRFLAIVLAVLPAGAAVAGVNWDTTVAPELVSASVFRGQLRGGAALQTTLESFNGGLGGGLWTSFPLAGSGPLVPGTEADLYGFADLPLGNLALVPGATLYTYPRAERAAGFPAATFEPSLALKVGAAGGLFTPRLYHDFTLKATTLELSAAYAFALPALGTELDWFSTAGTYLRRDDAAGTATHTRAWGNYWQSTLSVPYRITPRTRLVLDWTYAAGTGASVKIGGAARIADPRTASRGFVSLGFSSTF